MISFTVPLFVESDGYLFIYCNPLLSLGIADKYK